MIFRLCKIACLATDSAYKHISQGYVLLHCFFLLRQYEYLSFLCLCFSLFNICRRLMVTGLPLVSRFLHLIEHILAPFNLEYFQANNPVMLHCSFTQKWKRRASGFVTP